MNIFILDNDMIKNVEAYNDKHIVKMILESAQILSTVVRLNGIDEGYKITHKNHPCVKWANKSLDNWLYLKKLTKVMHKEWQYRYNHIKHHKSFDVVSNLSIPNLPKIGITEFVSCVPDECKVGSVVDNYRKYYIEHKAHLAKWTKREVPTWWE